MLPTAPLFSRYLGRRKAETFCPSRHFAATQQFGRFRSEADIERFSVCTDPVANDPLRTWWIRAVIRGAARTAHRTDWAGERTKMKTGGRPRGPTVGKGSTVPGPVLPRPERRGRRGTHATKRTRGTARKRRPAMPELEGGPTDRHRPAEPDSSRRRRNRRRLGRAHRGGSRQHERSIKRSWHSRRSTSPDEVKGFVDPGGAVLAKLEALASRPPPAPAQRPSPQTSGTC